MLIEVSDYFLNKCNRFADQRVGGSKELYAYRGESKVNKIHEDIVIGTMGELGVQQYFKSKGFYSTKPDMKIYDKRRKSFDADLIVSDGDKEYKIHVKSQGVTSAKRYGNSWLLQRHDKVINNPGKDEYFAFTNVDGRNVEILGIIKCSDIIKYDLLSECRVPRYRHTKRALYFEEIKEALKGKKLRRF